MTDTMSGATEQRLTAQLDLLRFYADAGVDLALDETPHDRLAEGRAERGAIQQKKQPQLKIVPGTASGIAPFRSRAPAGSAHEIAPEEAVASARELAASARTLEELRDIMTRFDGCGLKATATRLVFGDGKANARIMFVGEAPGREEDREGIPFVGRAGQLLNRMLAAIGIERSEAYIANVVPWRPPGNRTPTPQETTIVKPFIERQIELVAPDFLVCLGGPSSQTLLNQKIGILTLRGRWFDYRAGKRDIRALATLHPAYLLRQPGSKRLAWADLISIRAALDAGSGTTV